MYVTMVVHNVVNIGLSSSDRARTELGRSHISDERITLLLVDNNV